MDQLMWFFDNGSKIWKSAFTILNKIIILGTLRILKDKIVFVN